MDERITWFMMFYNDSDENPWSAQAATIDEGGFYHGEGRTKSEALNDLMSVLAQHGLA